MNYNDALFTSQKTNIKEVGGVVEDVLILPIEETVIKVKGKKYVVDGCIPVNIGQKMILHFEPGSEHDKHGVVGLQVLNKGKVLFRMTLKKY